MLAEEGLGGSADPAASAEATAEAVADTGADPAAADQQQEAPAGSEQQASPSAAAKDSCSASGDDGFMPADSFAGPRAGYVFQLGELGLGYYLDNGAAAAAATAPECDEKAAAAPQSAAATPQPKQPHLAAGSGGDAPTLQLPAAAPAATPAAPAAHAAGPRHHWGQALQYLEQAVPLQPGRRVALLARREEGKVRFALRQGVGEHVRRAPWKVEWGGGASVENPHFQRVHYCDLLVSQKAVAGGSAAGLLSRHGCAAAADLRRDSSCMRHTSRPSPTHPLPPSTVIKITPTTHPLNPAGARLPAARALPPLPSH